MTIGDTVLWKGKPAKIFGSYAEDGIILRWCIYMLNGRRDAAIHWVAIASKHLKA